MSDEDRAFGLEFKSILLRGLMNGHFLFLSFPLNSCQCLSLLHVNSVMFDLPTLKTSEWCLCLICEVYITVGRNNCSMNFSRIINAKLVIGSCR